MKPHQVRNWLNPNIENTEAFQEEVSEVFEVYTNIEKLSQSDVHVYSVDEKMGVKAREHINVKQVMKPGVVERIDPEYERHGTTGIIASFNVATGKIVNPMV